MDLSLMDLSQFAEATYPEQHRLALCVKIIKPGAKTAEQRALLLLRQLVEKRLM